MVEDEGFEPPVSRSQSERVGQATLILHGNGDGIRTRELLVESQIRDAYTLNAVINGTGMRNQTPIMWLRTTYPNH